MAAVIKGIQDTLDDENEKFAQTPLDHPIFINSVPKSGTHLIRNIVRMFVPVGQHYDFDFIQIPNLHIHARAFDPARPTLSVGHLLFADVSTQALGKARQVILVRDPYDWVLARTRFFLSDEFQQENLLHLKQGRIELEALLNMMIVGIHQKAPSIVDIYMHNAVSWLGTSAMLVRYEELKVHANDLESPASDAYFKKIFDHLEIARPDDWRERVRIGADPRQSRTARQNLTPAAIYDIPNELPAAQKRLVDVFAPGLRSILGYE